MSIARLGTALFITDSKRVPKIYAGAPHGLADTHKERINADRLAVLKT